METNIFEAIRFLQADYVLNAPFIEALQRGEAKLISVSELGVSAMHQEGVLYLSLVSEEALINFEKEIESVRVAVFFGCKNVQKITQVLPQIKRVVPCKQMIYALPLPPKVATDAEFRLLDITYTQFVLDNYKLKPTKESVEELLNRGYIYGAFVNGEIAGFIGRHHEGSMGLLEVLPKFRRQGLGRAMESFLIGVVLREGRVPYGHVEQDNDISYKLQNTIEGVSFAKKLVVWISTTPRPTQQQQ